MKIAENILKHSLQNVYFLVGTACGGKTTMGREIAKKHGFIYYGDNWTEPIFKVWESILEEKYQPLWTARAKRVDHEAYYSRTADELWAEQKQDQSEREYVEFSIIELVKLSQKNKVIADVWIEDWQLLTEIADHNRIACLLAPGELIVRDYYQREDHIDFTNFIKRLKNPDQKFAVQNELFRRGALEIAEKAKQYGLFTIMRSEDSTVEGTLAILENHFKLV